MTTNKIRENRLRRMANRQRLQIHKSPRRDTYAVDYGLYMISDFDNCAVAGSSPFDYSLTLDEVELYLTTESR